MMLLRPEGLFPSRRRRSASCTPRRTQAFGELGDALGASPE